jgi:hypothetical protein
MDKLIHLDQSKLDRWTKAALKEISPKQRSYLNSMIEHGYTVSKARLSGSKNDLEIVLERTTVLLADADSDEPRAIGMSEELREHIITKQGKVSRGRKQFRWSTTP